MRKHFLLLLLGLLATSFGLSEAQTVRPGAKGKAPTKSQQKEEPKIEGLEIARPDGTFLGLTMEAGRFKLAFYDQDKKPMAVNVQRAVGRWPNVHGPGQNRTILNVAGDGTYLLGAQFVRPPLSFRLFLILVTGDSEEGTENYNVDFHG
ncbi:MAG: hypothetical protein Q8J74_04390 [Candidatus Didemnitutus sp.]|nr:hypothetical protein [Candidatus Didemnitutus sp.]